MRVRVHPRVIAKRPQLSVEEVTAAFEGALLSRARETSPVRWVGVGLDTNGRLLEFIALEDEPDGWLIFHAMSATTKVLKEVGLK